ncbi:addiction module antidote protein [Thiomicrorhabdus xiamenensis]|uniref:Putative addiction module antidote protein n=1 Tax=Thiomicrorhabdus xiamenensis TaxID=2739063 RepID=A0A7D4SSC3_9GAMM|nr:addiction module antidote protein [Thiomicrorhabdus xiamenensis]QKI89223.1 putative addiction module antidote protein [Thiomicrorhabdus xiamenensis]
MSNLNSVPYDPAEYLTTAEDVKSYLEACLEENDPQLFIKALGIAARSQGMAEISKQTGLGRESLYKSFGEGKHPRFETVFKVIQALGLEFRLQPHMATA